MDPASATMLFLLFLATEKAVKYAGGKVADSMTKPIWEALEEKAKWLAGKDDTAKRWQAFIVAFEGTRKRLETQGRHPELAKQLSRKNCLSLVLPARQAEANEWISTTTTKPG